MQQLVRSRFKVIYHLKKQNHLTLMLRNLLWIFSGYDPNGDYIYTKGQHYGAEEWKLIADESMSTGERAVVIFANFGKKYLAIRNGKLTGVSNKDKDCVWILD